MIYSQFELARQLNLGLVHLPTLPVKAGFAISTFMWGQLREVLDWKVEWRGRTVP
jgi:hypothetical protein